MGAPDLQQAIQLLKAHYINPEAVNDIELNRAMLSGALARLGHGVMLLAERSAAAPEPQHPFFGEIIDGHIGYLRFGALSQPNLQAIDTTLQGFTGKKVDAVVVDLRASPATNDFAIAAEVAERFCAKGKPLFTLRKSAAKQERPFTSNRDPAYRGLMIVLADGDTAGPAEAIAGVLRLYNKALIIGQATAGRAVEYSDLPLHGGRMLRVAVAEAVLPEGRPLFPGGLAPDVPVEMSAADKRVIFEQSLTKGMAPFVFENERPHMNEAALLAGRNPELEAMEAAQKRGRPPDKPLPRDPVLQRALDVVTSLAIYQKR
jgi:carboxyl-terminal processing protease